MHRPYRERKWHIGKSSTLESMDADRIVGQKLAELRKRKGLRQEDFLKLLETQDVSWTQTVLSRVESGKRPLKLTEGFAIAEALGVGADELSPASSNLHYQIQKLIDDQKRHISTIGASRSMLLEVNNALAALSLAQELSQGNAEFTVQGSPLQFVELLSVWIPGGSGTSYSTNFVRGLDWIGLSYGGDPTPTVGTDEEIAAEIEEARAGEVKRLFSEHYPGLRFGGYETKFRVIGLTDFVEEPQNAIPGLSTYLDTPPRSWKDRFDGR